MLTGLDEDVFDADSTGSVRGECIEGYHAYGGSGIGNEDVRTMDGEACVQRLTREIT